MIHDTQNALAVSQITNVRMSKLMIYDLYIILSGKITPSVMDLSEHFTPQYATDWKVIGTMLDIEYYRLEMIEKDFNGNATYCCNEMVKEWLKIDTTASWEKLFKAIESCASHDNQSEYSVH